MSTLSTGVALRALVTNTGTITDNDATNAADRLAARVALAALIDDKLFANMAPESALPEEAPYLFFNKTETAPESNMTGQASLCFTTFVIGGHAIDPATRDSMSTNLVAALQGFRGTVAIDGDSKVIQGIFWDSSGEEQMLLSEGSDEMIYTMEQGFKMAHAV